MKITGIYKITNIITNDFYIGSSKDIHNRWRQHRWHLNKNKHKNSYLQNAWNKYGANSFKFEVLEECLLLKKLILEREQYYMDSLKPVYNLSPTSGSSLGCVQSIETKNKKSLAFKGKTWEEIYGVEEAKRRRDVIADKISKTLKGKAKSDETKAKMKGRTSPNKGKTLSEEQKLNLSIKMKEKILNGENNFGFGESNINYGKPRSDEVKKKISETMKKRSKNIFDN